MKTVRFFILFFFAFHFSKGQNEIHYPIAIESSAHDTLWKNVINDPYRYFENIHSDTTLQWIKAQEEIKDKYAGKFAENLTEHFTNYSRIKGKQYSRRGKYYFTFHMWDEGKAASLYYKLEPEDSPILLFDPNRLDKSAVISIDGFAVSEDNKTLALSLAKNGSDWKTIRFIDIESRQLLNDSINFVKYSPVQWSGNGVFYIKYDANDVSESFERQIRAKGLLYHTIGSSQSDDLLVHAPDQIDDEFSFQVTPEKNFLIIYKKEVVNDKKVKSVSYRNLPYNKEDAFKEFIVEQRADLYFGVLGELNGKLIVFSNKNARNGALFKCDPTKMNSLEKFIPQYKERLESSAIINDNKIILLYNGDKRSYAVVVDSSGNKLKSWMIPEGFTFNGLSYSRGDSVLVYYFDSFFNPSSAYKVDLNTFEQTPLSKVVVPFSFSDLTTEMVYYHSKDSTVIPMYLTHKKNIKHDGNNPVILYGYGGFGISMQPFFDVANIPFLNSGGILAVPQLRGGGDFPGWHEQGKRLKKQNTFDDFIAAAEFLISEKYTNSSLIAAMGGSNGGLLVGACMTQRPDLFKVVVSQAGVLDMLRYHLFNIGYKWTEEYGTVDNISDFQNLLHYSPVHNVKQGVDYPATLLVAGDNDDRVSPFHSFKFLSELQAKGSGKNPYVLYYQENAGHHGGATYDIRMKTKAYVHAFIYKYLGIEKRIYFED